jgi:hypothetical protein
MAKKNIVCIFTCLVFINGVCIADDGAKSLFDNVIPSVVKERKRINESSASENSASPSDSSKNVDNNRANIPSEEKPISQVGVEDKTYERGTSGPEETAYGVKPKKTTYNTKKKAKTKKATAEDNDRGSDKDYGMSYAGIKYWVDLESGRMQNRVTTDHIFQSGDRIKIKVVPNIDGYLYVFNKGTSGNQVLLYPSSMGSPSFVTAGRTYIIPNSGSMKFDDNPGREEIGIFLSSTPLPSAVNNNNVRKGGVNSNGGILRTAGCGTSKDLVVDMDCVSKSSGSKDLVVEKSTDTIGVAEYAVVPMRDLESGQSVSISFFLNHR